TRFLPPRSGHSMTTPRPLGVLPSIRIEPCSEPAAGRLSGSSVSEPPAVRGCAGVSLGSFLSGLATRCGAPARNTFAIGLSGSVVVRPTNSSTTSVIAGVSPSRWYSVLDAAGAAAGASGLGSGGAGSLATGSAGSAGVGLAGVLCDEPLPHATSNRHARNPSVRIIVTVYSGLPRRSKLTVNSISIAPASPQQPK